jgi:ATPase subunit of ABC transporter with duplicated ATPase domains
MNGWNVDSDAASMLSNLGITEEHHYTFMGDLKENKVRVLFASLFESRLTLLDEPTNDLDFETIAG